MTRRGLRLFFVCAALAAACFAAELPAPWRAWRYSRSIDSPHSDVLNYVALDRKVLSHTENQLGDLRIIDDAGAELPYVLRLAPLPPKPEPPTQPLPSVVRENSFAPGQFTQVVIDIGAKAKFHNLVRVDTPESDFINWVEVAASDDAHTWRIVKARAPISRFLKENIKGDQSVRYSENNARYLRLRIAETSHQFPVTGASVFPVTEAAQPMGVSVVLPLSQIITPDPPAAASQTQWTIDLGDSNLPVSELEFASDQAEFFRAARIANSADGKEWQTIYGGEIYRYNSGDKIEESLRVSFYESWGPRYWRVQILNGNDVDLSSVRLAVATKSRMVIFHPRPERRYRLIYGNARASAPQYDFSRTLKIDPSEALANPSLGLEELTANYADPRPFSERHPNLLWLALGIAVVLLGYAALRALGTPRSDTPR
jgi:hypothetical protein